MAADEDLMGTTEEFDNIILLKVEFVTFDKAVLIVKLLSWPVSDSNLQQKDKWKK